MPEHITEETSLSRNDDDRHICCLNDQGGSVIEISKDVTGTLRAQEHGHQPVIAGFNGWQSTTASMPVIKDGIPPIESTMPPYVLQGSMIGRQDKNGPQGDGINEDISFTLNATDRHAVAYSIGAYHSEGMKSDNPHAGIHEAEVARTLDLDGGSPASNQGGIAIVQGADVYNLALTGETAPALTSACGTTTGSGPKVFENKPYCIGNGQAGQTRLQETVGTLNCMHDPQSVLVFAQNQRNEVRDLNGRTGSLSAHAGMKQQTYVLQKLNGNPKAVTEKYVKTLYKSKNHKDRRKKDEIETYRFDSYSAWSKGEVGASQRASGGAYGGGSENIVVGHSVVRRLTPLECERLQGYPDFWTDIGDWVDGKGKKHKAADGPRYTALGNSLALPFWQWLAYRLVKHTPDSKTMASLFDGISGFCLVFSRAGCKPIWTSELSEFPIAVAKKHFGDDDAGEVGDYAKYL